MTRSLGRRGRLRGREIWIGAPFPGGGPDLDHLAFQAAHEATVGELIALEGAPAGDDRPLEAAALVLLKRRAERVGLGEAHARWLAHFGAMPAVELSALTPSFRDRVRSLLAG